MTHNIEYISCPAKFGQYVIRAFRMKKLVYGVFFEFDGVFGSHALLRLPRYGGGVGA